MLVELLQLSIIFCRLFVCRRWWPCLAPAPWIEPATKKTPPARVGQLAVLGHDRHVDHPPAIAGVDHRADLNLRVVAVGFDDGDDVFINFDIGRQHRKCRPGRCPADCRRNEPSSMLAVTGDCRRANSANAVGAADSFSASSFVLAAFSPSDFNSAGVSSSRVNRAGSRSRRAMTTSAETSSAEIIFQYSICPSAGLRNAPADAGGVQPAMLGRLAVEFRIDVAIDFDAVFEVAPAIDDVVAVGVDEFAEHLAVAVADDPAGLPLVFFGMDRATRRFGGRWGDRSRRLFCIGVSFRACSAEGVAARASSCRPCTIRRSREQSPPIAGKSQVLQPSSHNPLLRKPTGEREN